MSSFFKALLNRILRTNFTQVMIAYIAYRYIRFVYATGTFEFKNREVIEGYIAENQPFIIAFWHGHLLMMACAWQWPLPFNMLISNHRDGKLISKITSHFDIQTINGSTERQGFAAARRIIAKLKQGQVIGITPDGPRGPREQVSDGVLQLARLAKVDIIPVAYACTNMKKLQTWDHFRLTTPFSKGVFVAGTPIVPSKDLEQLRTTLHDEMQATVAMADAMTLS